MTDASHAVQTEQRMILREVLFFMGGGVVEVRRRRCLLQVRRCRLSRVWRRWAWGSSGISTRGRQCGGWGFCRGKRCDGKRKWTRPPKKWSSDHLAERGCFSLEAARSKAVARPRRAASPHSGGGARTHIRVPTPVEALQHFACVPCFSPYQCTVISSLDAAGGQAIEGSSRFGRARSIRPSTLSLAGKILFRRCCRRP